jgi:hypothetical protein
MIFRQKRQILNIMFALLIVTCDAAAETESNDSLDLASEIFQRLKSAEHEVSYVGKRLLISWTHDGCSAREELVVHQPPSIHLIKMVAPLYERSRPKSRGGWRKRGRAGSKSEAPIRRHFEGKAFFRPPHKIVERLSQNNSELLVQNYTVQYHTTEEKIAGYKTNLLTIAPRPEIEDRPTKRIWIAENKGVILRIEHLDAKENLRFLSVYTQISFQPEKIQEELAEFQSKKKFKPDDSQRRGKSISLSDAQKALDNRLVLPAYLPPGFKLQQITQIEFGPKRAMSLRAPRPTVHLRYTDGLMEFSLFESKRKSRRKQRGVQTFSGGGVKIMQFDGTPVEIMNRHQTLILKWFQGEVNFALISELHQPEIIRIAKSLILDAEQQRK